MNRIVYDIIEEIAYRTGLYKKGVMDMYKVMIVEDEPKIAEHLQTYIEKYGYQAIMVTNFERIMERFRENTPDSVLLDFNLLSFDGDYLCRRRREKLA